MKKLIVRLMLKLFNNKQRRQIHKDGECLGETLKENGCFTSYFILPHIALSWYVVIFGIAFVETLHTGLQYDIVRFKNSIFRNAIYKKEDTQ